MRVEMHCHTLASRDCSMSLDAFILACERKHIDCVCVTDHNTIAGALALKQRNPPFRVEIGEEITTREGEIIGYFLSRLIEPKQTPEETIAAIRAQGGIVSVPHPFDRLRHSRLHPGTLDRIRPLIDCIEVFNSRNVFADDDQKALAYAEKYDISMVVGSDAHSPWEVGRSTTAVDDVSSPAAFLASLSSARLTKRRSPLFVHAITKWNKFRFARGWKQSFRENDGYSESKS